MQAQTNSTPQPVTAKELDALFNQLGDILTKAMGKQAGAALQDLYFLTIAERNGVTAQGEEWVKRARRAIARFIKQARV